jgi:hypothetical protein
MVRRIDCKRNSGTRLYAIVMACLLEDLQGVLALRGQRLG